jgi:hypothetical protein
MKSPMVFVPIVLVLVMGSGLSLLPWRAEANQGMAPRESLQQDTRLQRTMTLNEIGISLAQLARQLSSKSLSLRVAKDCEDQKVQIHLKERPLYVLFDALSELLKGYWEPLTDNRGYEFRLKSDTKRYRDTWWDVYLRERDRARVEVSRNLLKAMRAEATKATGEHGEELPEDLKNRLEEGHRLVNMLPLQIQQRLADWLDERPYYSIDTLSYGGQGAEEASLVVPLDEMPYPLQETIQRIAGKEGAVTPAVKALYLNGGTGIIISILDEKGKILASPVFNLFQIPVSVCLLHPNHMRLTQEVRRLGKQAPAAWQQLARYHTTPVWKNNLSAPTPEDSASPFRADVLEWLHQSGNVEIVADYYFRPGLRMSKERKNVRLWRTVEEEMNRLAATQDLSWKRRRDSVYLVRNNRWYRDDRCDVSVDLALKWIEELSALTFGKMQLHHRTTEPLWTQLKRRLDAQAEVVQTLTPWQICNGFKFITYTPRLEEKFAQATGKKDPDVQEVLRRVQDQELRSHFEDCPFTLLSDQIMQQWSLLRFYAALSEIQRVQLLQGQLPWLSLPLQTRQEIGNRYFQTQRQTQGNLLLTLKDSLAFFGQLQLSLHPAE